MKPVSAQSAYWRYWLKPLAARPAPFLKTTVGEFLGLLALAALTFAFLNRGRHARADVGRYVQVIMALQLIATTKTSVVLYFFNISWERAIAYHVLGGFFIIYLTALHGLMYLLSYFGTPGAFLEPSTQFGIVAFVCFLLMAASGQFRRKHYDIFLKLHWSLTTVAYIASFMHYGGKSLVIFTAPALLVLVVDWVWQYKHVRVVDQPTFETLPGRVVKISFPKADTEFNAGQYLQVMFPGREYGLWERHPFTVSSNPESPSITLHIKAFNKWSKTLYENAAKGVFPEKMWTMGPVGSLSVPLLDFAGPIVLISGGIGCTPMVSILESLCARGVLASEGASVRFVWSVRDAATLTWFAARLAELQKAHPPGKLEVELYVTSAKEAGGAAEAGFVTRAGRPAAADLLDAACERAPKAEVAVLACGPHAMLRDVSDAVQARNAHRPSGAKLLFHEETFDM